MTWKIEFEKNAARELKKLDATIVKKILSFLSRLEKMEDPRTVGGALTGSALGQFWKYRVGDYRIISHIEDKKLTILIIKIGHRKSVYK